MNKRDCPKEDCIFYEDSEFTDDWYKCYDCLDNLNCDNPNDAIYHYESE